MRDEDFQSEDGCDVWISLNLDLKHPGFFVDCGASHPRKYSQTHWLRALGWRGIAIDGTPEYAPEWVGVSGVKFITAVLSDQGEVRFINERTNAYASRIHPEGEAVPARKLSSILEEHEVKHIDFLSIDIEGSEVAVMRDLFGKGFRPGLIVAEYNSQHYGRCAALIDLIAGHDYRLLHMTDANGIFVRKGQNS